MGDHRLSIEIKFSMHSHEAKTDAWLNWSDGLPERFAEWIIEQKDIAMEKWLDKEISASERLDAFREKLEREQLARLKAKYE